MPQQDDMFVIDTPEDIRAFAASLGITVSERGNHPWAQIISKAADLDRAWKLGEWRASQPNTPVGEVHVKFKAPGGELGGTWQGGEGEFKLGTDKVRELAGIPKDKRGRIGAKDIVKAIAAFYEMPDADYVRVLGDLTVSDDDTADGEAPKRRPGRPKGSKNKPKDESADSAE